MLSMFKSRHAVNEVFTPRRTEVNREIYVEHNVKLLIVGVSSGVKDYLSRTWTTVANRIAEISEVSSLAKDEVAKLV